ncbi:sugar-binding protein [Clostridium perfringens]|uniref:sugar-binding protein n=1 Tax=Clostridium perfringens TaxID=1502 RepID=UPI000D70EE1F|nr:sugar-binding protein [Clostridium perfringens]PWX29331.1 sugar-binding protein [Clostridium perfringens]
MKKRKIIALTTGIMLTIISTNVFAYEGYSLYADSIKNESILINNVRLKGIDKVVNGNTFSASTYQYNDNNQTILRDYTDCTIKYDYDENNQVKFVKGLMKTGSNSYVKHIKENFISEYKYDENGKVIEEIKSIYDKNANDLDGTPIYVYRIKYLYDGDKLYQKSAVPIQDSFSDKYFIRYEYNSQNQLSKITEKINSSINTLLLEYNSDGEISKATQNLNGNTKVIKIDYETDTNNIYSVYYVDPVKEWKVDMDFFALSYKPIKRLTEMDLKGNVLNTYEYSNKYQDNQIYESILNYNGIEIKYILKY